MNPMLQQYQAISAFIRVIIFYNNALILYSTKKIIHHYILVFVATPIDWNFKTKNEKYACLRNEGTCTWPRGKVLGGTTIHHGMAYHRGNPKDYAKWAAMGNPDWSWDKVISITQISLKIFLFFTARENYIQIIFLP